MNNTKKVIHIVGAGFSGLSLATYLCDDTRFDIHIFDKNQKAGGLISSQRNINGDLIESAAQSLIFNNLTKSFLEKINCEYVTQLKTAKKRFFFRDQLKQWPLSFVETIKFINRLLYSIITKSIKPQKDETVQLWVNRIAGKDFCNYVVSPALQGIYATTSDNIDAELIYNSVFKTVKKRKYLGLVSGKNGTQDIINSMTSYCKKNGVHFYYEYNYQFKNKADIIAVCTSAKDAASLLKVVRPEISSALSRIKMNSVATITGVFKNHKTKYSGFGALIPRNQNIKALGVLFNSDIFPYRSTLSSQTYIFSDIKDDLNFKNEIETTYTQIFKEVADISSYDTTFWPEALPVYNSHLKLFRDSYKNDLNTDIVLHGNYLGGIGLSKILEQSIDLALDIKKRCL